jgi:hypothetical protein
MLGLDMSATVGRIERMSPDNPLTVTGDGTLDGWREAEPKHFLEFENYRASLKPAEDVKPVGRPRKQSTEQARTPRKSNHNLDPGMAALAYQMHSDGHK